MNRFSRFVLSILAVLVASSAFAQAPAPAEPASPVEAYFYLGRQNESGAWAPRSPAFQFDNAREPKRVTLVRDAVLVDNINPDPKSAGGDAEAQAWTRVARRGAAPIALLEVVRQDSVGNGKLVWAKVRVPGERVEVTSRR